MTKTIGASSHVRCVRHAEEGIPGRRFVLWLYLAVVALAGAMGFVIGTVGPEGLSPVLFGVVPLPPTPVGTALYGVVTVGTILGVALGLVVAVSRWTGADER